VRVRPRASATAHAQLGPRPQVAIPVHAPSSAEDEGAPGRPAGADPARAELQASPLAFYRGTASLMAGGTSRRRRRADCGCAACGGDAGTCRTSAPTRRQDRALVFDLNDFDEETLPGPFEWDVKRLATRLSRSRAAHRGPCTRCPPRRLVLT